MAWHVRHVGLVLGCVGLLAACDDKPAAQTAAPPPPPAVGVIEVTPRDVQQDFEFVGRVVADRQGRAARPRRGFPREAAFTEGPAVKAGDLLFSIEKDQFQATVDQSTADLAAANAVLTNAQVQYQRPSTLVEARTSRRRRSTSARRKWTTPRPRCSKPRRRCARRRSISAIPTSRRRWPADRPGQHHRRQPGRPVGRHAGDDRQHRSDLRHLPGVAAPADPGAGACRRQGQRHHHQGPAAGRLPV